MNYKIEIAPARYISELPEISKAAAELFPIQDLPLFVRAETISVTTFEKAISDRMLWIVIDEKSEKAVGFAYLTKQCGQIHLSELDIHPQHGRRGLGTKLLKKVIIWAKSQAYSQLTLTTFIHLPWNAPFYSKLGFKVIERGKLSSCLSKLLDEEAKGLDKSKRVLMRLDLN